MSSPFHFPRIPCCCRHRCFVGRLMTQDVVDGVVHCAPGSEHPALRNFSAALRPPFWVSGRPPEQLLRGEGDRRMGVLCKVSEGRSEPSPLPLIIPLLRHGRLISGSGLQPCAAATAAAAAAAAPSFVSFANSMFCLASAVPLAHRMLLLPYVLLQVRYGQTPVEGRISWAAGEAEEGAAHAGGEAFVPSRC